jgi:hypothetical protein
MLTKKDIERDSPKISQLLAKAKQIDPNLGNIDAAELLAGKLTETRRKLLEALSASAVRLAQVDPSWGHVARTLKGSLGVRHVKPADSDSVAVIPEQAGWATK